MKCSRKRKMVFLMLGTVAFVYSANIFRWQFEKLGINRSYVDQIGLKNLFKNRGYHASSPILKVGNIWKDKTPSNFCIGAVVLLRIYAGDKPELTTLEAEQWIRYLQYSGIEEIYLYDAFEQKSEKLESWVQNIFQPSEVLYHDWHNFTPYGIQKTQVSAYKHATQQYKKSCKWHLAMDIDEYPFVLNDTDPGFLKRLISYYSKYYPKCAELSFKNIIFSGYPGSNLWLIERYQRRFSTEINFLHKPLYIADKINMIGVHHNALSGRISCDIAKDLARMNHYWGARLQKWKPDTPDNLNKTIIDRSALEVLHQLKTTPLKSPNFESNITNRFWKLNSS